MDLKAEKFIEKALYGIFLFFSHPIQYLLSIEIGAKVQMISLKSIPNIPSDFDR